ncbi:MAG: T9SS type A sorting domain-containing protein [Bacteroidetes bacterium]|nr:T9SS type A sorting domain-containing protein [Bacteroidota bacterium]
MSKSIFKFYTNKNWWFKRKRFYATSNNGCNGKILINQSRKAINTNELFIVSKNNLSAGIYFYKVVIDGGRIFTGKLVVE